jgi:membrane-associated phospholipid phosphatase
VFNFKIYLLKKILILIMIAAFFSGEATAQGAWEIDVVRSINPDNGPNKFWKGISSSAAPISLAMPFGMLAVSLINHDQQLKQQSFEILGSLVIATATTQVLKRLVNRPRPYETFTGIFPDSYEEGKSFPSGHTTTAFSTAASLTLTTKKWYIAVPAFVWATGVGYARINMGQHYPSDVMMGALIGTASGFASHWLMKKITPSKKQPVKQLP